MFGDRGDRKDTQGVVCTVGTCHYHTPGHHCTAGEIRVGTEYAEDKAETFCSTYSHKA